MNKISTELEGVFIIEPRLFSDARGEFIKTHHKDTFLDQGLDFELAESYYSTSKKDVIRGMHFQTPPHAHIKLIYVTRGAITDVILDLRNGSPTYGKHIAVNLSEKNRHIMYIPVGCAHGFLSLKNDSCVVYLQTTVYAPQNDGGIRFDSFGMEWGVEVPLLSDRDKQFPTLETFNSPFTYTKATP